MLSPVPARAADPVDACVASYVLAQRLRKAGDLVGSKTQLTVCMAPQCPTVLTRDCGVWLREVDTALPTFIVDGRDPEGHELDIRVSVDGQPISTVPGEAIAVNPGLHEFEVRSGGAKPATYSVLARPGEKGRHLQVVFPQRIPREVWILAGLGLAEAGVASYFVYHGYTAADDCSPACTPDQSEAVRVSNTAARISAGMAVLSLGAAGWLYWTRPRAQWSEPTPANPVPRVGLQMRPAGALFQLSGRF